METVVDRGRTYQVYTENQLVQARYAKARGEKVYIVRKCGVCGCYLYGSNVVKMRKAPVCETH